MMMTWCDLLCSTRRSSTPVGKMLGRLRSTVATRALVVGSALASRSARSFSALRSASRLFSARSSRSLEGLPVVHQPSHRPRQVFS